MKIGIDARPLARQVTGIPRVLANVVRELERIDDENDYYLYSYLDFTLPFENPRWRKCPYPRVKSEALRGLRALYWPSSLLFDTCLSETIRRDGLDIFWGTLHVLPLGIPSRVAKVLQVYDLVWHFYPETMSLRNYVKHKILADRSIRTADKVITISESTRGDLEDKLAVPRDKIRVIYPAAEAQYRPHDKVGSARHIAEKYQVSENYICTVGTVEPRKNLIALVEAVKILRQRGNFPYQVLVAGAPGWRDSKIYASVQRFGLTEREFKFLGYLPEEDLPLFYSGAFLFVYPSLYEGFGLPLVEAMACGAPIVASDVSSVSEVVQDASILVSSRRPEAFADAIGAVMMRPGLRAALIEKGLERSRRFRYDTAARETLRVFREVSSEASRKRRAAVG